MKKVLLILGAVVCLGLVTFALYVGLNIGLSVYIAYTNRARFMAHARQVTQANTSQMQGQINSLGDNMTPDRVEKQQDAEEMAGKRPTFFVDPEGYGTEDNWLATVINREIAEMAFVTVHPDQKLPELKIKADVDPAKPLVHIEITGFASGADATLTSDLTPVFAWDPEGYAPLARQLLGNTPGSPPVPDSDATDVLGHLLTLTATEIALEDVRISGDLQQHPASWQDHEQAALLLTAQALREPPTVNNDNRNLLDRATAHLALAQALRVDQPASWPGLIADAAIRTLAGRELDVISHLDALAGRADCPDSAKTWITALRVLAKDDWRPVEVKPGSPLLLKIIWFQVLENDLTPEVASKRLKQVIPLPNPDPNAAPSQTPTNPDVQITDWERLAGKSLFNDADLDAIANAQERLDLEFNEFGEVLKIEGCAPVDLKKLAATFSEPVTDTVSSDASGKTVMHIIGPALLKDSYRRHLFACIPYSDPEDKNGPDPAQLRNFYAKLNALFQGVPGYDLEQVATGLVDMDDFKKTIDQWETQKRTWPVWEVPFQAVSVLPGSAHLKAFYCHAVPFGTVYQPVNRMAFIHAQDPVIYPSYESEELEQLKKLPVNQAILAIGSYNLKYNASLRAVEPKEPTPFEQSLLKLDPDEYYLATDHVSNDKLMAPAMRFLDYRMNPVERIENLDSEHLSDADREIVLRKHVEFDPTFSPSLSDLLRKNGKDDEAAEVDRKDLDEITDPQLSMSILWPLINYDLDHGLYDEVLSVAKKMDLSTEKGQAIYFRLLEYSGKQDEAEAYGKQMLDVFKTEWPLVELYVKHRDHFPAQYAAEEKKLFPKGLLKVSLSSFSDKPQTAAVLSEGNDVVTLSTPQWRMQRAGLQTNEVVVALDGYRVESSDQYTFIQMLSNVDQMDFIVWRDPNYQEIKATVPHRRLNTSVFGYKPPE